MKIFKRLRGFLQRRIPLLRRKKKDKSAKINEGCEDTIENEISNQIPESVPEANVEFNEPSEQLNEESESDVGMSLKINDFEDNNNKISNETAELPPQKNNILECSLLPGRQTGDSKNVKGMRPKIGGVEEKIETSKEGTQFPVQRIMILDDPLPPNSLEEKFKNDKRMSPKREEIKEDNQGISNVGAQFSASKIVSLDGPLPPDRQKKNFKKDKNMTPNKEDFIVAKNEISRKGVPCPLEKFLLWDGPLIEGLDETLQEDRCEAIDNMLPCDDENERSIESRPLLAESSEELEGSWNLENNPEFEVDFESAFDTNEKEADTEDPWYYISSTKVETLGHNSKETSYHQLALENVNEIDEQFDAVFGLDAKKYEENRSYDPALNIFQGNTPKNEYCNESVDYHYNFEDDYDDYSDEQKPMETVHKKKLMMVIRDRPSRNLAFEKLFRYSDIDNVMHLREIKDPLNRKERVRSDLTGFKHVPFWDSKHMKKYYSEGDLGKQPPDFSMVFAKRKE